MDNIMRSYSILQGKLGQSPCYINALLITGNGFVT